MGTYQIILLIIIGILSGVLSGLIGIGGGLILVPFLMYMLNYNQLNAQGTSLAVLLLPIGIFAVINYYNKGYVNINATLLIALGFLFGAYFGSKLAFQLPIEVVKKLFGITMLTLALRLIFY